MEGAKTHEISAPLFEFQVLADVFHDIRGIADLFRGIR